MLKNHKTVKTGIENKKLRLKLPTRSVLRGLYNETYIAPVMIRPTIWLMKKACHTITQDFPWIIAWVQSVQTRSGAKPNHNAK